MKPRTVPISSLLPDKRNANKGTKRGAEMIEDSLRRYGAGRSILVDKKGRVIAGNKTLEQAGQIGMDSVLVVETDGSSIVAVQRTDLDLEEDTRAKELAIADNRSGQVSLDWDTDVLAELVDEIDLKQFWSPQELTKLLGEAAAGGEAPEAQIDKAAELQKKWKTECGQIWEIGKHRLMCGDSSSAKDVAELFRSAKAALMATDPPYGVAYGIETGGDKYEAIANDDNDGPRLQAFLESVFKAATTVLREDAAWYLWHAQLTQGFFAAAAAAAAVKIHRQIIWVKPKPCARTWRLPLAPRAVFLRMARRPPMQVVWGPNTDDGLGNRARK